MTKVLVVDNHDSFVHILIGYLHELGAETVVVESDEIDDVAALLAEHEAVLVSPGPGSPATAGASIDVVREAARRRMPLLGVCLGHQALGEAFGATVGEAPELMHGMVSAVEHDGSGVFAGLPSPFQAGRYHSLAVIPETLPGDLVATARAGGVIMGMAHRELPLQGVQFHPESVLTEHGHRLLQNWLDTLPR
jgi:para-aminobenzoate synthetase component II